MTQVIWSPEADQDVDEIYVHIGLRNVAAAERFLAEIGRKLELLERHPKIGVQRPDLEAHIRMLAAPPYLIFYELQTEPDSPREQIRLVRILDGRRDLKELL